MDRSRTSRLPLRGLAIGGTAAGAVVSTVGLLKLSPANAPMVLTIGGAIVVVTSLCSMVKAYLQFRERRDRQRRVVQILNTLACRVKTESGVLEFADGLARYEIACQGRATGDPVAEQLRISASVSRNDRRGQKTLPGTGNAEDAEDMGAGGVDEADLVLPPTRSTPSSIPQTGEDNKQKGSEKC